MGADKDIDRPSVSSHLFMLRLWPEDLGCGQTDWRGSVQHVNSGEVRYFRAWPTFAAFIESMINASLLPSEEPQHHENESMAASIHSEHPGPSIVGPGQSGSGARTAGQAPASQ